MMEEEKFKCAFIEHGATFYPDNTVAPCCQVSDNYREPANILRNSDRFSKVRENYKDACKICLDMESKGIPSHRLSKHKICNDNKIRYLDIRNTNKCNLKCRMCNPHYSDKWGKEMQIENSLVQADISEYDDIIFNDAVEWIYFTGGEPLINGSHWEMLQLLVDSGRSKSIKLQYNTNMTTVKYKQLDIFALWAEFKHVHVLGSIDAIDKELEYIRSGVKWEAIDRHIKVFNARANEYKNFKFDIQLILSIMNIWSIEEVLNYFVNKQIKVNVHVLTGPDILALNVMPDLLQDNALAILHRVANMNPSVFATAIHEVENNINKCLFEKTMLFTLLLDSKRNENLFNLLPFAEEETRVIGAEL